MVQCSQHLRLARKAGHAIGILREGIRDHLDRDIAVEFGVGGAVYRPHAAFAELARDSIVGDRLYGHRRTAPMPPHGVWLCIRSCTIAPGNIREDIASYHFHWMAVWSRGHGGH